MSTIRTTTVAGILLLLLVCESLTAQGQTTANSALDAWRTNVTVRAVSDAPARHTIHSYYVCNPESPDGRLVLFYASTSANGYVGEIVIRDRATGSETTVARDVHVEDAHRAACQQWICNGRRVAFHDLRDGHWVVVVVDVATLRESVVAVDRQLAFGQPAGDLLPIYGCHWRPGLHRDLELVNADTGEIRTALTAAAVTEQYGAWLTKEFGDRPISVFFPVLSPDQKRVFIKIAAGSGKDNFMSSGASHRQGLIVYDLEQRRFTMMRERWGHPAWHPDSRHIVEMGNLLFDGNDGSYARISNLPNFGGCHPSISPDSKLMVTDGTLDSIGGAPGQWGAIVADLRGEQYVVLHRFDNTHGAKSWRRNHPHPVANADGRRIYFNVSSGDWTQLYVAEQGSAK